MMNISFTKEKVTCDCSPDTILTELSFSIEAAINWYLGHGVASLEISRGKFRNDLPNGCFLTIKPLSPPKPFVFSAVASIGILVKEGYFPQNIPFDKLWSIPGQRQQIKDGQHRLFQYTEEETVIQTYGLLLDTPASEVAWGLADLVTGLFWEGAKWVKWQSSVGVTQISTDKGFTNDEMKSFLDPKNPDYALNQTVSTLS